MTHLRWHSGIKHSSVRGFDLCLEMFNTVFITDFGSDLEPLKNKKSLSARLNNSLKCNEKDLFEKNV